MTEPGETSRLLASARASPRAGRKAAAPPPGHQTPAAPREALLLAIARCEAILAGGAEERSAGIRELILLETGAFDSRVAGQPGPSAATVAALRRLRTREAAVPTDALTPDHEGHARLLSRLAELADRDGERVTALGKAAASARRVHCALQLSPIASVARLIDLTGLQVQSVTSALHRLRGLGIVREITRRHRHRLYSYDAWLALLEAEIAAQISAREAGR